MSPLTFVMSTTTRKSLRHPATLFLGNLFWRPSCLSPSVTRTPHLWVTSSFLSLNSKHDFYYVYSGANTAQTFSIALTIATHNSLKHLAAIIPSQLNNYFLLSFLHTRLAAEGYPLFWLPLKLLQNLTASSLFSFISNNIAKR